MASRCEQSAIGRYNSRKTKAQLIEELESLQDGNDELKHTLHELRENLDLAQKAAREIVWDWSEKTGIFNTSPGAWNKLGLADLPRRITLKNWKDIIHTDDVDRFWTVLMAYLKGDTDLYENEYRINQKDGGYRWVCDQGLALRDQNGRVYRMAGTISDITERKRTEKELRDSERRFRAFMDASPLAILMKDVEGRFLHANRCWHEWFNPEGVALADKTPDDFLPRKLAAEITAQDRMMLATGKSIEREYETFYPNGKVRNTLIQKFPIFDSDGNINGIGGISVDITERNRAEHALREAKAVSDYANRAKSEFLANMSHELRTPLNAIIGFSDMIRLETFGPIGSEKYREYVSDICSSGTHLLSLINDILDLSKIEAGAFELKEESVDVAQAVSVCRRIIKERVEEAELTLAIRLSSELPRLWSDERAIKQIVLNLLSNAVKFTPAGGRVTVCAEFVNDGCFALSISDTGIGISADDISKVFAPFTQIDGSLSRKHDGSGLGLALAKSLVEMHGGTLDLKSEVGDGTIATITFPAERVFDGNAEASVDRVAAVPASI